VAVKDAGILMLRHQLAVAERERPRAHSRLAWPDRAWLALLAGTVPAERLAAMRLIVTPGTIVRWQRGIIRRRWARRSRRGRSGRPATHRRVRPAVLRLARENESWGLPADPRRVRRAWHRGGAVHGLAGPQGRWDQPGTAPGRPRLGAVPAVPGAGDPGAGLLLDSAAEIIDSAAKLLPTSASSDRPGGRLLPPVIQARHQVGVCDRIIGTHRVLSAYTVASEQAWSKHVSE
jgi:hypothetical protein